MCTTRPERTGLGCVPGRAVDACFDRRRNPLERLEVHVLWIGDDLADLAESTNRYGGFSFGAENCNETPSTARNTRHQVYRLSLRTRNALVFASSANSLDKSQRFFRQQAMPDFTTGRVA